MMKLHIVELCLDWNWTELDLALTETGQSDFALTKTGQSRTLSFSKNEHIQTRSDSAFY